MNVDYALLLRTLVKFGLITQEEAEHEYINHIREYDAEIERLGRDYARFKQTEWKKIPWWRRLFASSLSTFVERDLERQQKG